MEQISNGERVLINLGLLWFCMLAIEAILRNTSPRGLSEATTIYSVDGLITREDGSFNSLASIPIIGITAMVLWAQLVKSIKRAAENGKRHLCRACAPSSLIAFAVMVFFVDAAKKSLLIYIYGFMWRDVIVVTGVSAWIVLGNADVDNGSGGADGELFDNADPGKPREYRIVRRLGS
ncbi:hypothetical protein DL98DRAFT_535745 [Cadophora sp. DSE1049]|nr:hypothetical protein DL98DRAFT_535745 [Cadophora sp. DSE1049]